MPPEQEHLNMPPEHEDLNRQLEALGRYVSNLQHERAKAEAAQPPPGPGPQRPSRRWLLLTGLLIIVALVGGGVVGAVAWSDDQPAGAEAGAIRASSATQGSNNTTTVAPVASLACKTAVDRANTMLAIAVKLQRELAEYSRTMSDPSTRNLSGREVVEKSALSLQAGSSDSARFDQALADYRQVVDQCKLRTP
jgi:hypothetical protein